MMLEPLRAISTLAPPHPAEVPSLPRDRCDTGLFTHVFPTGSYSLSLLTKVYLRFLTKNSQTNWYHVKKYRKILKMNSLALLKLRKYL